MRILNVCAALGCGAVLLAGAPGADAATIESFDNGWYAQDNNSSSAYSYGVTNINVGWNRTTGATYRNWLAFDVSSLAGQNVTSATLNFYGGNGDSDSPKTETLGLFDYTGSISSLLANQSNVGIYNDLGTGASFGQTSVASGPMGAFSITLTAAGIDALNAAANSPDKRFVIGGSLLSIAAIHDGDNWYNDGQLFRINGPQAALDHAGYLDVQVAPVPIPAALPLLLGGLGVFGLMGRKKKATTA